METLEGHAEEVLSVSFNQNNLLASGSWDNTIRIWNTQTWSLVKELKGHTEAVFYVCFNHNNLLASGLRDKTIRIWKPAFESGIFSVFPRRFNLKDFFMKKFH